MLTWKPSVAGLVRAPCNLQHFHRRTMHFAYRLRNPTRDRWDRIIDRFKILLAATGKVSRCLRSSCEIGENNHCGMNFRRRPCGIPRGTPQANDTPTQIGSNRKGTGLSSTSSGNNRYRDETRYVYEAFLQSHRARLGQLQGQLQGRL